MVERRDQQGRYTYADYLTWPEDERWELIDGVAVAITPAPTPRHQRVLVHLVRHLERELEGTPCVLYPAPFDVRLSAEAGADDGAISTVVQPDISVVCDGEKVDDRGCVGAPDLVVEILSPGTAYRDQTAKLDLFEAHGVREYWIVNPERGSLQVYLLEEEGGFARPVEHRSPEELAAVVLSGVKVGLEGVFAR